MEAIRREAQVGHTVDRQHAKARPKPVRAKPPTMSEALLAWYDQARRDLPWRAQPGETPNPYGVWLSEVMLQQTTVKTVGPYWQTFMARWPTVAALAAADRDAVLSAWAGLGYYARARNLHACARAVVELHGGAFPRTAAELRTLPGIGEYTAAAVAAIAFGEAATPVDGNIERVMARVHAVETPLPTAKPELKRLAATHTPKRRPGDHAQALMDLGATICTPRSPSCLFCPLKVHCQARALGIEADLPARRPRPEKPLRRGHAFVLWSEDGHLLLRRRPETGLLAGMMEVPSTDWFTSGADGAPLGRVPLDQAPVRADWWPVPGAITHVFTHFRLEIGVVRAVVPRDTALTLWARQADCRWVARSRLADEALPTVMRKIIAHAVQAGA
jgi:A/G-specific adenine glycosylase